MPEREEMPRRSLLSLLNQDPDTLTEVEWLRVMRGAMSGVREPYWRVFRKERPECGAKCRDGHACKAPAVLDLTYRCAVRNGRCRNHGGLSTGPRTPGGKDRVAEATGLRLSRRRKN